MDARDGREVLEGVEGKVIEYDISNFVISHSACSVRIG